jgi:hypothetical protein
MAILVSPGVSVTVTDESQYGPAGPGTVPLLVIATAQDKLQPGSATTVAPGTTKANAGKLYLITSQRDALQTFGNPEFYSSSGTVQYANELNEIGLFTLYEYLGIANRAYVVRADIDLRQLIPTSTEPAGPPIAGQGWLDLSNTTWGVFRSSGNPNPAFAWQPRTPLVINSVANLEKIVQGRSSIKITSGSAPCITTNGSLVINGISISVTTLDSVTSIANKINSSPTLDIANISATVFARVEKISATSSDYSDVYNLRIVSSDINQTINLSGSSSSVLLDLGLSSTPNNVVVPVEGFGTAGDVAVNTLVSGDGNYKNEMWEKIEVVTSGGSQAVWFKIGSTDTTYPGWGWKEASPVTLIGSVANPSFTGGQQCTIKIGSGSVLTVTVPGAPNNTLAGFVGAINTQLNASSGTQAVATIYSVGSQNYLRITNYAGTDITINDISDQTGTQHPWRDAGLRPTNTYWANVTGTVSNPTFVAATLKTDAGTVVAAGSGYEVNDPLTVVGGTASLASVLNVASIKVVGATPSAAGTGYSVNDRLTFTGGNYTSSVILNVDSINGSGGITGVSIVQAGQFTGTPAPTSGVAATSVSPTGGTSATFDLVWGVNTVTVSTPGSYTVYPSNPVSVTGGTGTSATFNLTPGYLTSNSISIDVGSGPVIINVPAASATPLTDPLFDRFINEINNSPIGYLSGGPIVASKTTDNKLKIVNSNGTSFVVEDVSGTPLNGAGIAAGVTFGRSLTYQGYQPSLTVPSSVESLAAGNIWINTTSANQGAKFVVKKYNGVQWQTLNVRPNTATVPMYSSTATADAAFGSLKQIGSTFVKYNSDGLNPVEASFVIMEWNGSSWDDMAYRPSATEPNGPPEDGTLWYNSGLRADIMVNDGVQWLGYKNLYPATDPNGPILSSAQPTVQSTLNPLVDYDIWIDTNSDPYPTIYRYDALNASWILIDNADQTTSRGIVFADARPNADGTETGSEIPSDMVTSNYIDPDAPDALLYPAGMLLFNTRYSTNNVKVYRKNYLSSGAWKDRWVTYSGNRTDGSPYMGSAAQRISVVRALQGALVSNQEARAENVFFNLLATPGYVECLDEMVSLNTDKKEVAFIVGDTPATLEPNGTDIVNWATNSANASGNGAEALITATPYAAVYYPWGLGTNLNGSEVLVPPSMIALRTIAYNDQVAYPWFAPAGFNRGIVTGVSSVGYITDEGDFAPITLNPGQRDVLYENKINPIAYIPGRGLVVYGQRTLNPVATSLDRINVARLINYLKYNLDILAKPFLFEPNDTQTRENVTATFKAFMQNLVTLRGLFDFAVVCDDSNNTPDRIDRNELWIDIAIKPTKAVEFIYIPIRILNTGDPLPGGGA